MLVVVDMQVDFVDGALGTTEAEAIVPRVCEVIQNWDGTVIATLDTHAPDYLQTQEGRNLPVVPLRVLPDACAGVTPAAHDAALTTMASCQVATA